MVAYFGMMMHFESLYEDGIWGTATRRVIVGGFVVSLLITLLIFVGFVTFLIYVGVVLMTILSVVKQSFVRAAGTPIIFSYHFVHTATSVTATFVIVALTVTAIVAFEDRVASFSLYCGEQSSEAILLYSTLIGLLLLHLSESEKWEGSRRKRWM
jgi:hypothetical protein